MRPQWQLTVEAPPPLVEPPTILKVLTALQAPVFAPMVQAQGKHLMASAACVNFHSFLETLRQWETGVPVDCRKPWTWTTIEAAVEKGAHKLATMAESIALISKDVAYQIAAGYAKVIFWEELCTLRPSNLKVSPLVVPQRDQRRRMILELSFAVQQTRTKGRK